MGGSGVPGVVATVRDSPGLRHVADVLERAHPGGDPPAAPPDNGGMMTPMRHLPRFPALGALLLLVGGCAVGLRDRDPDTGIIITGPAAPGLEGFDREITALMATHRIPGAAVSVVRSGRLVLARGYGYSDVEAERRAQPTDLFRIASVTKPITATAILTLVQAGRLALDQPALPLLAHLRPEPARIVDPRVEQITVRQLLQHTGGWDRQISPDPFFVPGLVTRHLGTVPPPSCEDVIRYAWSRPLDFAPGTRFAYSNLGYCILGRIIERVSGERYEAYVQRVVLRPAGIHDMRLGRSRLRDRAPGEVRYYPTRGGAPSRSVFPDDPLQVPTEYGGFYLRALDAVGGWVGSAVDLARFSDALLGRHAVLSPRWLATALRRPPLVFRGTPSWYGCGWWVRHTADGGVNVWHDGSLPGTTSMVARIRGGVTWAALFNSRPRSWRTFAEVVDRTLWAALRRIRTWPDQDLWDRYR